MVTELLYVCRWSSGSQQHAEDSVVMQELAPRKLPGKLSEWTGNVMYPNEDSAVWDVNSKWAWFVITGNYHAHKQIGMRKNLSLT